MKNIIELEYRAEVKKNNFIKILNFLRKNGRQISKTKRLSVMFFGKKSIKNFDVRVRITNGDSEIVIKKGGLHAHNRTEQSQKINKNQFMGMVGLMSLFDFEIKVGEREAYNFSFKNNVVISLVKAGNIAYLEFEKITDKKQIKKDGEILLNLIKKMNVSRIRTKEEFNLLCNKLSRDVDWKFNQTDEHYKKLEKILLNY
jgi:hypothetical protein